MARASDWLAEDTVTRVLMHETLVRHVLRASTGECWACRTAWPCRVSQAVRQVVGRRRGVRYWADLVGVVEACDPARDVDDDHPADRAWHELAPMLRDQAGVR